MRGHEDGGEFGGAGHAERLGSPRDREHDEDAGDGLQVAQERGIVVRAVGERVDGVVGPLMVVFSLEVEAEVGGVGEELGVDGEVASDMSWGGGARGLPLCSRWQLVKASASLDWSRRTWAQDPASSAAWVQQGPSGPLGGKSLIGK